MYARLLKIPLSSKKSFFLFGPRGTGKTSWVRTNFPDALYLDLLDADVYTALQGNPKRLGNFIKPNFSDWIILDEVQKIPELLDEIHRLIEHHHYRFILTGSSARSLRRKGINLLAGRALHYSMHPFTAIELGNDFDLKRALQYGQMPTILTEADPRLYLKAYVKGYLREEVLQEGLTRNLSAFTRFLEVASFSQGSLLNLSAIAREVGVHQKVISDYFQILEDLLLSSRLPVFTKRAKRRLVSHPKFYFFDVGVYRTLRPLGPLDSTEEISGSAVESLFLQELKAVNDYLQLDFTLYFWRTSDGTEVDFIAYGPHGLFAFEVKAKAYVDKKDTRGLRAFRADFPMAKLLLVYGGDRLEYDNDIEIMPIEHALKQLPQILTEN